MSYRPMMLVGKDWCGNALRFASKEEAAASAEDLFNRWLLPRDWRVDESPDPVSHSWDLSKRWPEALGVVEAPALVAIGPVDV